jgi:hypothetical protein
MAFLIICGRLLHRANSVTATLPSRGGVGLFASSRQAVADLPFTMELTIHAEADRGNYWQNAVADVAEWRIRPRAADSAVGFPAVPLAGRNADGSRLIFPNRAVALSG